MARFDNPAHNGLPPANEHANGHEDGAQAPEFPGAPEGLPLIPVEEIAGHLPEEADDHLPDFFGPF